MQNAVYKFPLKRNEMGELDKVVFLPKGATIQTARRQGDEIVLYALVNPEIAPSIPIQFRVVATGEQVEGLDKMNYLSTVKFPDTPLGDLFFHVYIEKYFAEGKP